MHIDLVPGDNLVPRVFSLSNVGEREDPGGEETEELWGREIKNMADDFTR